MDPLSITTACVTLTVTIGKVSLQIHDFVRQVRDARRDPDGISRELGSLKTVLSVIAEDAENPDVALPSYMETQISGIVANCGVVVGQIQDSLEKFSGGGLRKGVKWAIGGRDDMDKLHVSLEAHKSALELVIEMVNLSITRSIKEDTLNLRSDSTVIFGDTTAIKSDTAHILAEMGRLRSQFHDTSQSAENPSHLLERYLDSLTSYAETEYDDIRDYSSDDLQKNGGDNSNPDKQVKKTVETFSFRENVTKTAGSFQELPTSNYSSGEGSANMLSSKQLRQQVEPLQKELEKINTQLKELDTEDEYVLGTYAIDRTMHAYFRGGRTGRLSLTIEEDVPFKVAILNSEKRPISENFWVGEVLGENGRSWTGYYHLWGPSGSGRYYAQSYTTCSIFYAPRILELRERRKVLEEQLA